MQGREGDAHEACHDDLHRTHKHCRLLLEDGLQRERGTRCVIQQLMELLNSLSVKLPFIVGYSRDWILT